jgi:hypothetical protein
MAKTNPENKIGRPRHSDKQIHAKKKQLQNELTRLRNIHASKRTARQMKRMASVSTYIHRITRRQRTGFWK